jgi:NAD(P)-dependent dehydrogenase (short-subunit alcohol dehydrogenase family)
MDATRHAGKVVIVTGAGSGIGLATALRFAKEGAKVVGCDVNAAGLEKLVAEAKVAGKEAESKVADVTRQGDVDALVDGALVKYGRIDVLANVAGIMDFFLPAHEVDDATWQRVMSVNLDGPMRLCRRVLPAMMKQKKGAIVNVASAAALGAGAAGAAYTTSKHALVGLTRSIAWTYRNEGIRCNAVCPGAVETNIGTTAAPKSPWAMAQLGKSLALAERTAKPDEIATLLSWLASDEASNVNGSIVSDDGGWRAA